MSADAAAAVTPELLRSMPLPRHGEDGDKNERGRVLVIGGSVEMPGGALLAGVGALRAGAGKLQVATCRSVAPALGLAVPEARVIGLAETAAGGIAAEAAGDLAARAERCGAVLVGPGMTDQPAVDAFVAALMAEAPQTPLVLDAAALSALRAQADVLRRRAGPVVLTPHHGEMASLLDLAAEEVAADPVRVARRAAADLRVTVALKGGRTVIAAPDGRAWRYGGGGVGLATSGSGDALAGIVAGLLARGASPETALLWAVHAHGEAGARLARSHGQVGFLARELLAEVPAILEAGEVLRGSAS